MVSRAPSKNSTLTPASMHHHRPEARPSRRARQQKKCWTRSLKRGSWHRCQHRESKNIHPFQKSGVFYEDNALLSFRNANTASTSQKSSPYSGGLKNQRRHCPSEQVFTSCVCCFDESLESSAACYFLGLDPVVYYRVYSVFCYAKFLTKR